LTPECVFCQRVKACNFDFSNDFAVAFPDHFPLADGHMLIIPKRHEIDIFALTPVERGALWNLVDVVFEDFVGRTGTRDCNIGVNNGVPAGQTIGHAHVHLIPRRLGDIPDPRGGVRWVIPKKAPYWSNLSR
jgi:diadenosine tetraphosphate (Ap4A) HIT family hydrolase